MKYVMLGIYLSIGVILGLYWGYIGVMEKKMETTGIIGAVGLAGNKGKQSSYNPAIHIYIYIYNALSPTKPQKD